MALILIMIILFSFPIIFLLLLLQKQRSVVRLPQCPSGIPIISHIRQFDTSNRALHLYNLSKQYDPIASLRLSSIQTLVISSVKVAKEAFKTHDLNFSNRPSKSFILQLLGCCFTPLNGYWTEMRTRFVTHQLNSNRMDQFSQVRNDEISHMRLKRYQIHLLFQNPSSEITMMLVRNIIFSVGR